MKKTEGFDYDQTYTLVNKQSGELAFKLYRFESIRHFDHIQRSNYYSLIWIEQGKGKATVDIQQYNYSNGQIFCAAPYQPFMFEAETKTQGIVINFHPDFFCIHKHHSEVACDGVLFNNIYQKPFFLINSSESDTLTWLICEIEKDIQQNQLATNEAILSYLKLFLIHCSRIKKKCYPDVALNGDTNELFIIQKLRDFIETNYKTLHSPKEYADLLHISPNALAKIVKKEYNTTLTDMISNRIIIEAKRELYLTDKSVEEIATELGYEDQFYFSRFFKKHTDISPSIYRKTVGFNRAANL